ncbi:hypothetical protein [Myceligenerans crystallogenes]|uniref:Uncharacterized protein n=1 Tax=Myceligenerans crystallogenes TaxID=316335 RepID=A0ABP4ZPF8_9MICO
MIAALAVGRWIEDTTSWSLRRFVTTARQHRTITLNIDGNDFIAENPLPDDPAKPSKASRTTHTNGARQEESTITIGPILQDRALDAGGRDQT